MSAALEASLGRLLLLALLLWALPALAEPTPRIALVTMAPGEVYWTRFGHNALLVADPESGSETVYNYGIFDFDQPGFLGRFLRGHMRYRLAAMPAAWDLPNYAAEGREVVIQWLALDDRRARELAAFLAENALPANAEYDYHYFLDNCSTRVRDALDAALGGALREQSISRSRGFTWRAHASRLTAPDPWLWLGIDLGLGPRADQRLSAWDEMFIPMAMRDYLRGMHSPHDGARRDLVEAESVWSPARLPRPPEMPPDRFWLFLGLGVFIGGFLSIFIADAPARRLPRVVATAIASVFWLFAGLAGCVMLALWLLTDHGFAHRNENLFLLNPLALALLPVAWTLWRGGEPSRLQRALVLVVTGLAAFGFVVKGLPFFPQQNAHWIALFLPIHLGLGLALGTARGDAGRAGNASLKHDSPEA
jgi:hypothetical protein